VKKYIELARIFFKAQLVYRFDVIATAAEAVGKVLFAWLIWGAVFAGREEVSGFTFRAMLLYYVISSCLSTLEICFGVSGEISHEIRNGTFSRLMVIPVNQQLYWLARNLGAVSYLAVFVLPAALISGLLFGAGGITAQPAAVFLGIIMVPMGLAFMVTYHFFIGILAFKYQDVGFFRHIQESIIQFTQGAIVPLTILPQAALGAIRFLPFPHVVFTPAMLFMGRISFGEGLFSMGVLAAWLAVMSAASQRLYKRMRVKYDGVGI
jgi:ABC-2 type transport system permease protein